MKTPNPPTCPLCRSESTVFFHQDRHRGYHQCPVCCLVFVPPSFFLPPEAEKAEYDLHQNSPDDQGYRRFLSRIFTAMELRLSPECSGLDFGSGPGPTLSSMFEEAGYTMTIYDHFYAREPAAFKKTYDFITATEVVEHLHDPLTELERLWACLKSGGILGIMTKLVLGRKEFARWHYKNDLTHVCFFSRSTFRWLASKWHGQLEFTDKDIILIRKNRPTIYPVSMS